jgi:Tfp pilus assembly protein PilZ
MREEATMQPTTIDISLGDAAELRNAWLDGFQNGGMFIPGSFSIAAGAAVLVRVHVEKPTPTTTLLLGTVIWRRLPQRDPIIGLSSISLRAGIGISFVPSMQNRVLFLDRLARGTGSELRSAARYPTALLGELSARTTERPVEARVLDVAVRGARVALARGAFVDTGSSIELRMAMPRSGEMARAPLRGTVAWVDRATGTSLGVRLDLSTTDERLIWAKVVTRAREDLEAHPIRVDRQVG